MISTRIHPSIFEHFQPSNSNNILYTILKTLINRLLKQNSHILLTIIILLLLTEVTGQNKIDPNGYNKFYYDNGQLSSEGFMVNGKPTGKWMTYYESGQLKSEGNRIGHDLDSIWRFYSPEGLITDAIRYEEGKKLGFSKKYSQEGFVISKELFVLNKREGFAYYYYPTGELKRKMHMKDDMENGVGYEFRKNGTIHSVLKYKNGFVKARDKINRTDREGRRQGKWREFYPCPEPCAELYTTKIEGRYSDDMKHGYFREYDRNGILLNTTKYVDGVVEENAEELLQLDIEKEYYPNAKVKRVKSFKHDKPEGVWRDLTKTGEILGSQIYKAGVLVGEGILDMRGVKHGLWKEYYSDGMLRAEGEYRNGQRIGEWLFYYRNGKIEQRGKYAPGERPHGLWKWYYESGNSWREENFRKGLEEGELTEWSDSGVVITKGGFLDGEREGFWTYRMGDHREEGKYIAGGRDGEWKHYYDNGKLNFIGKFVDDAPNGKHTYYHPTGKRMLEGRYEVGFREGEWKRYNDIGELLLTILYKDGAEKKFDGVKIKPKIRDSQAP